jgi:hypothetical protein
MCVTILSKRKTHDMPRSIFVHVGETSRTKALFFSIENSGPDAIYASAPDF